MSILELAWSMTLFCVRAFVGVVLPIMLLKAKITISFTDDYCE